MRDLPPHIKKLPGSYFDQMQEVRERWALENQREEIYPVALTAARLGLSAGQRANMFFAACCYPGQGGLDALRSAVTSHSRPFLARRAA